MSNLTWTYKDYDRLEIYSTTMLGNVLMSFLTNLLPFKATFHLNYFPFTVWNTVPCLQTPNRFILYYNSVIFTCVSNFLARKYSTTNDAFVGHSLLAVWHTPLSHHLHWMIEDPCDVYDPILFAMIHDDVFPLIWWIMVSLYRDGFLFLFCRRAHK